MGQLLLGNYNRCLVYIGRYLITPVLFLLSEQGLRFLRIQTM